MLHTHSCKLNKALYYLKQELRAWFFKLSNCLQHIGFHSSKSDTSMIYHLNNYFIIYLIYIDDILIIGNNSLVKQSVIDKYHSNFSLNDLGEVSYFLGLEVTRIANTIHLAQKEMYH